MQTHYFIKFAENGGFMETADIRQKLHQFIDMVEDKRAEAIYTLFEEEIEQGEWEYTDEFKAELDNRYEYYKNGGKMISAGEADEQVKKILQPGR
jgi:hypothetical protein